MNKDVLYGYLFHYNSYSKEWNGFLREDSIKYFNGDKEIEVLKSKKINTIIGYINQREVKEKKIDG